MSGQGNDLQDLTFPIGNLFNSDFDQWLLSFGNVAGISKALAGVTLLEDLAAEMEEGCKQLHLLHLAEGAGKKAAVRELWGFLCLCHIKESKTKSSALRVSEVTLCRLG